MLVFWFSGKKRQGSAKSVFLRRLGTMFFFRLITVSSYAPEFQRPVPAMSPLMTANVNATAPARRRQRRLIISRAVLLLHTSTIARALPQTRHTSVLTGPRFFFEVLTGSPWRIRHLFRRWGWAVGGVAVCGAGWQSAVSPCVVGVGGRLAVSPCVVGENRSQTPVVAEPNSRFVAPH